MTKVYWRVSEPSIYHSRPPREHLSSHSPAFLQQITQIPARGPLFWKKGSEGGGGGGGVAKDDKLIKTFLQMGSCISCNHPSDDPEHKRNSTTSTSIPGVESSSGCSSGGGSGVEGMRDSYRNNCLPTAGGSSSGRGGGGGGGSEHGIKGEKKTFYSRIPPLGRSGSDKKIGASSIKDNNNAYSESKITALFEQYKDGGEDAVLAEGIDRLCKDLEVKPEDFKMLVLAWKFGASQMCRFSREEFFQGMKELKTDTLQGIQARLPDIVVEVVNDAAKFKELYRFSFKFGLDCEVGQRILPMDMAVGLWGILFSHKSPPILEKWIRFLGAHPHIRGITQDTWYMFLNLVEAVGDDLGNYDDSEAWPSLFDDFVEYENDELNQNTISNNGVGDSKEQQYQIQQVIENSINSSRLRDSGGSPNSSSWVDGGCGDPPESKTHKAN